MATISNEDTDYIKDHPLSSPEFESLRATLKPRNEDLSASRDAISDLLDILQTHPVAKTRQPLKRQLTALNLRLQSDFDLSLSLFDPLTTAVADHTSDLDIWKAVLQLIDNQTRITPPPSKSIPPSYGGTPFVRSSASHQGTDQTRRDLVQQTPWTFNTGSFADTSDLRKNVDPILKTEVEDNLRIDHPGVFATFFGKIPKLAEITTAVFESCKEADPPLFQEGVGWVEWPEGCEEVSVLQFLRRHIDRFLLPAEERGSRPSKHRRCITTPNKPIPGSVSKRKLDVGLAYNANNDPIESEGQSYDWSHILIPGELKSNPRKDNHSSTWLDLVRYAREIFSAQDTRRFVLGFTLCGPIMRIWEFDRLGVVGSTPFDINKDAHMFVSVVMGFLWMSKEQLGFDPTIAEDGVRSTTIQRNGQRERICLEDRIKRQRSVAGRATTCWKGSVADAPDQVLVIKDSWEYEERPEEGLLLKEATEAGVENVARYYYHETVRIGGTVDDVLKNVRKGLSDTAGRNPLQQRAAPFESITSPATSLTSGPGRGRSRSSTRTTGRKRSRSGIDASMPPPKRSCSDSPVKQDMQQRRNRVHRRVVMRDVGKSVYEASSPRGILTGLLGGIKGHESLLDVNILHRDISIGNVMLNTTEDDGFLIDLDLAIKIDRTNASGAPSKTGTKVFMAIGALYGEGHNFMHDLESFFWVLFWACIHCTGPGGRRRVSKFEAWNFESTENLAKIKTGSVLEEDKFIKEVQENSTAYCTPLIPCVKELRKVVFPEGKRWPREDRGLYSRMKSILQQAKDGLDILGK